MSYSIALLSPSSKWIGGFNILFPFFKWNAIFKEYGVDFKTYTNHENHKIRDHKVVFIVSRYFQVLRNSGKINNEQILEFLHNLKSKGAYIIYFDAADSTGSRDFFLIEYVDVFLKKQVLKDKNKYLENYGDKSVRIWISDFNPATT